VLYYYHVNNIIQFIIKNLLKKMKLDLHEVFKIMVMGSSGSLYAVWTYYEIAKVQSQALGDKNPKWKEWC
jgi:hypothetical protein